jgi:hypothetical protein
MNKYILLSASFIIASFGFANAQSTTTSVRPSQPALSATATQSLILLAQVDIFTPKVQKSSGLTYTLSFELRSSDLIDQEAYYRLIVEDTKKKVVFVQSFPDKVSLKAGETVSVSSPFVLPQDLEGDYNLSVQVTNPAGLPLAKAPLGKLTLVANKDAAIRIKDCTLLGGDKQGLNKPISVTCSLDGKIDKYGALVSTLYYGSTAAPATQVSTPIDAKSETFTISPRTEAGTYQLVTQVYQAGIPISIPSVKTFLIDGQSVQISNIIADKGEYKFGEKAKLAVAFNAFNFKKGELFASAKVQTRENVVCGEASNVEVLSRGAMLIEVPINSQAGCALPTLIVTFTDKAGMILDTKTVNVVAGESKVKETTATATDNRMLYASVALLAILGIVVGLVAMRRFKKKEDTPVIANQ